MGHGHSSNNSSSLSEELEFLSEHSDLSVDELGKIYDKYFRKKSIKEKEFLKEFKAIFPR